MAAGYLYGKRYSQMQVVAVVLLTLGVILAAWSDAQAKVDIPSPSFARHTLITLGYRVQVKAVVVRPSALDW
jgi:hypothetical protein